MVRVYLRSCVPGGSIAHRYREGDGGSNQEVGYPAGADLDHDEAAVSVIVDESGDDAS